ncbi:GNAT family N-acetyltransferase [Niveispirillum sp. BGYR6]|uniref:GNAT family N-acetyltransferase n=1 Tax=Niveispirillum sp. BGYR6 TaxID=2971249 RepID=UPI0022B9B12D|nr:GNAT family N-acetyltransferase [Niveispirillum sp. BGYR6]MDG5495978.1 GNAT family N-acetyltransferase [Niveispirillum sp. BGYR6]
MVLPVGQDTGVAASSPDHATLMTARLVLRPLSRADLPAMHGLLSDPDSMKYWSHPPHTSLDQTEASLDRALVEDGTCRTWAITTDGQHCQGWATIFAVKDRIGWVGYILSPALRGHGHAEEAMRAVLDYGFEVWGLHRLTANIDPRNHASGGLLRRLGFTQEGLQRRDYLYDGDYLDTGVFGLLADEWRVKRNLPGRVPVLHEGPVVLRPLRNSDADALHAAYGDEDSMRYMPHAHYPSIDQTRAKIAGIVAGVTGSRNWAITTDGGECLGWALLHKETTAQIELGYILVPAARGRGLVKAAGAALLRHAFVDLGKHRVEAVLDPRNLASAGVLRALGFTLEGVRRQGFARDDEFVDSAIYGLLAPEWADTQLRGKG